MNDWRTLVTEWLGPKRLNSTLHNDLLLLFGEALPNTMLPEESGFGHPPKKSSIGVFYRNLMLVGVVGRVVEVIVDEDMGSRIGYRTRPVGTSIPHGPPLYWLTSDIKDIGDIARMPAVWEHYRKATLLARVNPSISGHGNDYTKDKVRVSSLFEGPLPIVDLKIFEESTRVPVQRASRTSRSARLKRLAFAPVKAASVVIRSRAFIRNSDVIAEVLFRAGGICERCDRPAPFQRDLDGTPYLEVHHVIPLAENGDDTVSNALALCPNCHRHAHLGKASFHGAF